MTAHGTPLCPSSTADTAGAQVFAVVTGTPGQARAAYLDAALALTPGLAAQAAPAAATEVFRIAAPCARGQCAHFAAAEERCRLGDKVLRWTPVVVQRLPRCAIRARCVWWSQAGASACRRCPQIVTDDHAPDAPLRAVAHPDVA